METTLYSRSFSAVFHLPLQQNLVLSDTELSLFTHRQQNGMFFVPGTDGVNHAIALQEVFLT
jgi:hypothetical protein